MRALFPDRRPGTVVVTTVTKIGLITGGIRGLGRAAALASAGPDVVLTYRSNEDEAAAVVTEIEAQCQLLHDLDRRQVLLVFTATPGTENHEKPALLAVLARQRMSG
jgi:NAD(P)-dependent dehydrogenase (short-subunit alcohol dehydrogenase family)